jgi:hypothetical protein
MILQIAAAFLALTLIYLILSIIYKTPSTHDPAKDEEEPLLSEETVLEEVSPSNTFLKVCTAVILLLTGISCIAAIVEFSLNVKDNSLLLLIDHLTLVVWIIVAVIVLKLSAYYHLLLTVHIMAIISQSALVLHWILEAIKLKGNIFKFYHREVCRKQGRTSAFYRFCISRDFSDCISLRFGS